jgi:hypothetical protein
MKKRSVFSNESKQSKSKILKPSCDGKAKSSHDDVVESSHVSKDVSDVQK